MNHRVPFLNIRTEGALLPSDLLSRLMEGTNLPGLKPEDYHLGAGEKLNEAISRSWTRLLSLWAGFRKAKGALPSSDRGTTLTRERWLLQLFQELGYGRLIGATPFEIDGKTYPISHIWQGQYYQIPIHLVSFRADLDKRSEQRIQGASKSSPHGMVQEFLNRSAHSLWALVSNGLKLVILRDNASLTRQAHVEFDLEGIFEGEAYADFRLLWMVCHESRLEGTVKDRPETCWLELWSKQAQTEGRRALDQLRDGVQRALENLGTGFISHKANQNLCQRLKAGELNKQDLYRQLLRLVYRLIFLFVAEDRDLLHSPGASEDARSRYARFYSGQRLRRMAERTRGTRHADLWVGLRLVFARLGDDRGCPELGLPALGGFLFGPEAMPELEFAELANEHLLMAIRNLGLVKDRSGWRLVDYRNLGSEELGSVYESLLELNPTIELDAGVFTLSTVAGNQRKTSGSYYTPDSLVQCLLDSALDPVVEQATKGKTPAEAEKAILALKVCDPAVGSGHFLVGAAHRLAKHLAQVRAQAQGESEPSPLYYQHALRDIIGHCLYGVDVNPMAAELCRVSLWLEAIEPGKPLSFLDHHIRVGNSLLGATPALLSKGVPDEAFMPIEGDDKEICSRFKKVNKEERAGQGRLFAATTEPWERLGDLAASMAHLDAVPDDSIEAVRNKQRIYEAMVRSGSYLDGQFWADAWCAAFVWKKSNEFEYPITEEVYRRIENKPDSVAAWMRGEIKRLAEQYQFFHWHLAFPDVFHVPPIDQVSENEQAGWNGGFDVVLGNPPWERVQFEERAFFAANSADIFAETNQSRRRTLIQGLAISNPQLFALWQNKRRQTEAETELMRRTKRFPLSAVDKFNTYAVFTELGIQVSRQAGSCGLIVKAGLITDKLCADLFSTALREHRLKSAYEFENRMKLFPEVDSRERFALMTFFHGVDNAEFSFDNLAVESATDPSRTLKMSYEDVILLSPNTGTCPKFPSPEELEIARKCYRRFPPVLRNSPPSNPWRLTIDRYINASDFSNEIVLKQEAPDSATSGFDAEWGYAPLYEGKLFHQYDHRFASYSGVTEDSVAVELEEKPPSAMVNCLYYLPTSTALRRNPSLSNVPGLLAARDITNRTNERGVIAAIIPPHITDYTIRAIRPKDGAEGELLLLTVLNSFVFDFLARQRMGGTHLSNYILEQLPCPTPADFTEQIKMFVVPRAIELTYTAWDLKAFAVVIGYDCPPFKWDSSRRSLIRYELDALYFHLYGLLREEVSLVLDAFPITRGKEEKLLGEYRTKRIILEIYDAMAEATRTGIPYQTRLSPPPGDAAVAHPWQEEITQVAIAKDAFSGIAALPDDAWATPVGVTPDNIALFSLIDVLRKIGEAVDPERVRLAAILVRKPVLAAAFMEDTQADQWLRVIGSDARPLKGNVVQISQFQKNGVDYPWAAAFGQLKGSGALVVDSAGKWSAGSRLPASSGQDWVIGRAAIAVQLLSAIEPTQIEQRLIVFNRSVEDGTARRAVS